MGSLLRAGILLLWSVILGAVGAELSEGASVTASFQSHSELITGV